MNAPMPVAEREYLAQVYANELAPRLRIAIDRNDADRIAELIADFDHQHLLVLVIALASRWPSKQYRKLVVCRGCGEYERHEGAGLCRGCHVRWDNAGRPDTGPPPPVTDFQAGEKQARLEDYADLVAWGTDDEMAACRIGVAMSTIRRYKADLRSGPFQLRIPDGGQRRAS